MPPCIHAPALHARLACAIAAFVLGWASPVWGQFDWSSAPWHVRVRTVSSLNAPMTTVTLPGVGTASGNVLEVFYEFAGGHTPQLWAFQTNGFWRQVADGASLATSYRMFWYYSSSDEPEDESTAAGFDVVGVDGNGRLELALAYTNDANVAPDTFDIDCAVALDPPTRITSMDATVTITNTGADVEPCCGDFHLSVREQWALIAASTMYVVDHLTGGLPSWYDTLDPNHDYVGITNDADPMNDGHSVNGGIDVPTHDTARIVLQNASVRLDHDIPHVVLPGFDIDQLVLIDEPSEFVSLEHLHSNARNHEILITGVSGIVSDPSALEWAVTYNRTDKNMVDGDNVQVKLLADGAVGTWMAGSSQTLNLRLTTGPSRPVPALGVATRAVAAILIVGIGVLLLRRQSTRSL